MRIQIPVKTNVGGNYALIVGNALLGAGAALTGIAFVGALAHTATATVVATMTGPIGLAIMGITATLMAAFASKAIKEKVRTQLREKLPQELHNSLIQIADELKRKFLAQQYSLETELREIAEAPAIEIKAQLQQQEVNLNQLLNDKKSQEINIQKQQDALIVEKTQFEQILVEIKTMV